MKIHGWQAVILLVNLYYCGQIELVAVIIHLETNEESPRATAAACGIVSVVIQVLITSIIIRMCFRTVSRYYTTIAATRDQSNQETQKQSPPSEKSSLKPSTYSRLDVILKHGYDSLLFPWNGIKTNQSPPGGLATGPTWFRVLYSIMYAKNSSS